MQIRKITLLLVFLFSINQVWAGHEKGGVIITYESVAGPTGNPLKYVLRAYAVYETGGIGIFPSSLNISISSSCFPNSSVSLPITGSLTPASAGDYCTPGNLVSTSSGIGLYRDTITLPGTCADFRFFISTMGGRYMTTENINDNYSGNAYFYADLNNTLGPNSSPVINDQELIQGFCINKPLQLYGFTDSDGDSLYFTNSAPAKDNGGSITSYPYKASYSINNQVGSSVGYNLNPSNGSLQTTLAVPGYFAISMKYDEFRTDPTSQSAIKIGEGRYTMIVMSSANCNTANFQLTHAPSAGTNPSLQCGATSLQIATSRKIASSSMTSSGSEIQVFNSNGSLGVSSAQLLNDSLIEIQLAQALPSGNPVSVVANIGTDGDVIYSICGKELNALSDTLNFNVTGSASVTAAFSHTSNLLTANFNSAGSISDSLSWDFGDGSPTSNQANPSHTYTSAGTYQVSLVAYNICGQTDTSTQSIQVCDSLLGGFNYSFTNSDTLHFDASVSSGASFYYWDFGDGNQATGVNTNHSYSDTGVFVVTLTVSNACGDSTSVTDTLENCPAPVSSWTYEIVSSGGNGMTVDFDGTTSQNASSFVWDFGDGNKDSSSLTPTHTYLTPSLSYYVTLEVTNACGNTSRYGYKLSEIGLKESELFRQRIFPNPTDRHLNISWESKERVPQNISLLQLDGQELMTWDIQPQKLIGNAIELQLPHLPEGIYLILVEQNGNFFYQKLQVQR